jgi:hypothetical protein
VPAVHFLSFLSFAAAVLCVCRTIAQPSVKWPTLEMEKNKKNLTKKSDKKNENIF